MPFNALHSRQIGLQISKKNKQPKQNLRLPMITRFPSSNTNNIWGNMIQRCNQGKRGGCRACGIR